jgi:hypothetical protein
MFSIMGRYCSLIKLNPFPFRGISTAVNYNQRGLNFGRKHTIWTNTSFRDFTTNYVNFKKKKS